MRDNKVVEERENKQTALNCLSSYSRGNLETNSVLMKYLEQFYRSKIF